MEESKQKAVSTKQKAELEKVDWLLEGERRFGPDQMKWKFQCPACKAEHSVEEFRPFKDKGALASSAYQECIGRYTGGRSGPDKCDWASYGLFHGPCFVVAEDGKKIPVFAFAETRTPQENFLRIIPEAEYEGVDLSQTLAWDCPVCEAPNTALLGAEVVECTACGGEFEVDLAVLPDYPNSI